MFAGNVSNIAAKVCNVNLAGVCTYAFDNSLERLKIALCEGDTRERGR